MTNKRDLREQAKENFYSDLADKIYLEVKRIAQENPNPNFSRVTIPRNGYLESLAQTEVIQYGVQGILGEAFIVDESQSDITVCFMPGALFQNSIGRDSLPKANFLPMGKKAADLKVHHAMVTDKSHKQKLKNPGSLPPTQKTLETDWDNF
ncbi:hypothetical protein COU60_02345 [Candidatus Pacearchaeota archaeon CG10_big_fil_rev_8_21_14_0_10_34_76]|nr:MAG: hypothetical protein COU60_02345 [Candidatus Pacearchaeota archaeon CG10_big_fil_rev_8_21_14_0_10_34_76]